MRLVDAYVSIRRQRCQLQFPRIFCSQCISRRLRPPRSFRKILQSMQKMTQLQAGISVNISMRPMESLRNVVDTKKDARLTIRIPKELKDKIEGIDRLYGVALPKIANECLKAFCDYVEQQKQTPTFPLSIRPLLLGGKTRHHASIRRRRGIQSRHRQRA
jgi:hypothetical protein